MPRFLLKAPADQSRALTSSRPPGYQLQLTRSPGRLRPNRVMRRPLEEAPAYQLQPTRTVPQPPQEAMADQAPEGCSGRPEPYHDLPRRLQLTSAVSRPPREAPVLPRPPWQVPADQAPEGGFGRPEPFLGLLGRRQPTRFGLGPDYGCSSPTFWSKNVTFHIFGLVSIMVD